MVKLYLYWSFVILLTSCTQKAVIRFSQKPPELTSGDALTEVMLVKKAPRIVLRVPNTRKGVTNTQATTNPYAEVTKPVLVKQTGSGRALAKVQHVELLEAPYDQTALYNAIEKQLFKEGFSVRDRGLFNQVLDANQNIAYSQISSLTDTDLILELVRLDTQVGYTTNNCFIEPGNLQRIIADYRDMSGASVEFKLVHVKSNELVGSYKIHYTPCLSGCRGLYKKAGPKGVFTPSSWLYPNEKANLQRTASKAFEQLDQDALEAFITDATHELVKSMR